MRESCTSTITFHSGSLRDGIHYMAAKETDMGRKEKAIEMGRYREKGEKEVIHPTIAIT